MKRGESDTVFVIDYGDRASYAWWVKVTKETRERVKKGGSKSWTRKQAIFCGQTKDWQKLGMR
jgi:hypothetical protein